MAALFTFLRFGMVGALGFVVDAGLMQALVSLAGWGPVPARAVSIPIAVFATWLLNHSVTFRGHDAPPLRSLARYFAVSAAGAAVNFAVYTVLVLASVAMAATPLIPLAIASIIALIVNFFGSKHFAFR
jgi:putative flippase GtrA